MSTSRYLVKQRNSTVFYFRIRIPKALRGIVEKSELRYSVRTSDHDVARARVSVIGRNVRLILKQLKKLLRSERKEGHPCNKPEIIKRMFEDLLQKYLEKWLNEEEERRALRPRPLTEEELERELDIYSDLEVQAREDLALSDYRRISRSVDEILTENGIHGIEKDSEKYRKLCRDLLKTDVRYYEIEQKRAIGDYQSTVEQSAVKAPDSRSSTTDKKSPTLSEVIQLYSKDQQLGNCWTEKTTGETLASLDLLQEVLGNLPVNTITPLSMRDFKSKLMALPPNHKKSPKYRGKSVEELLSLEIDKTMSVITINKHLTRASGLFRWAAKNSYMDRNPAEGLQIASTKRDDEYRNVFTDEDLRKLFLSEAYLKDTHKYSYCFWVPLIALYTGMRLDEICQLHLDDLLWADAKKAEDGQSASNGGIYVIDVNNKDDKKLKNKSSRRVIPLHDFLVNDMNLPGYVEQMKAQGHARLFPELKKRKEGHGKTASSWFGRYREKCGVGGGTENTGKKDFHSFRHTVGNFLKQSGVEQSVISELLGHSVGSITLRRYGKRYIPRVVKEEAVDRLNYGIDLSHLKRSRFVVP